MKHIPNPFREHHKRIKACRLERLKKAAELSLFYTNKQICEILGINRKTLYRYKTSHDWLRYGGTTVRKHTDTATNVQSNITRQRKRDKRLKKAAELSLTHTPERILKRLKISRRTLGRYMCNPDYPKYVREARLSALMKTPDTRLIPVAQRDRIAQYVAVAVYGKDATKGQKHKARNRVNLVITDILDDIREGFTTPDLSAEDLVQSVYESAIGQLQVERWTENR